MEIEIPETRYVATNQTTGYLKLYFTPKTVRFPGDTSRGRPSTAESETTDM